MTTQWDNWQTHWRAVLVSIFFVIIAGFYAQTTAPFEAPDESSHMVYVNYILTQAEFPRLRGYEAAWGGQNRVLAAHHPPLYYLTLALPIQFTERSHFRDYFTSNPYAIIGQFSYNNQNAFLHRLTPPDDTLTALAMGRSLSILMGFGTLWMVYLTALALRDDKVFASAAMLLTASIPTFVFISASVNNDNLATLIFSASVYFAVRTWQAQTLTWQDGVLLGIIFGGAVLTKLNVVFAIVAVYGVLGVGALRHRFTWREVITTGIISAVLSLLLGGWWYLRNFGLYGDPFALEATLDVWGRGSAPDTMQAVISEARGVWLSFWFMMGHLNIQMANWFYDYVNALVIFSGLGTALYIWQDNKQRDLYLLLVAIASIVIIALVLATQQVNVSQGRVLFPGLVAYAILLTTGLYRWLGKYLVWVAILPLTIVTAIAPYTHIRPAHMLPQAVDALPADVIPVNVFADELALLGYRFQAETLAGSEVLQVDIFIRGTHPDNPSLFVKLLDPVTLVPVGGVDTYPNMALTSDLDPDTIYRIRTRFALQPALLTGNTSRQLRLTFGWRLYDADEPETLVTVPLSDGDGTAIESIVVDGPAFINADYVPDTVETITEVNFGNLIALRGYTLSADTVSAGDTIRVTTNWQALANLDADYVIGMGLLDDTNTIITQRDGDPIYFPTSRWLDGIQHQDTREIAIPVDVTPATYRFYITLYGRTDGVRLSVVGDAIESEANLFILPQRVTIVPE